MYYIIPITYCYLIMGHPKSGVISSGPGINDYIMPVSALWVATLTQLCWARERNDGNDAPAHRQTAIRPTYVIANTCT